MMLFCFILICLVSFRADQTLFSVPPGWPKPSYALKDNPLSVSKINIGRSLFYDNLLSNDNTISCSSCHLSYTAFTHVDHALSHGIQNRIGKRNSPALMNLAWHNSFMWDGAIHHLDMQALAPIQDSSEMDNTIAQVVHKLIQSDYYKKLFQAAYSDGKITGERLLKCIAQFLVTLVSANSKYDKMKRNEVVFTKQEQSGYALFLKNCSACHTEPLFTNGSFQNNGLPMDEDLHDIGRMKITKLYADSLKFKVPTLRNIAFSFPYMHDGRFKHLSDVLKHYTNGIVLSHTLSPILQQTIKLSSNEKVDLTAFLLTLSDTSFLFNPNFAFPEQLKNNSNDLK